MSLTRAVSKRWQEFWFAELPPESFALVRIALGLVGLVGVLSLTPVSAFWALDGMVPAPGGGLGVRAFIGSVGLGTLAGWALFLVLLLSFAGMVAGVVTRAMVPLAFAASVVQAAWNPMPLAGSHRVLICFLFCLLGADTGRALNLAHVVRPTAAARSDALTLSAWPLRLMQIQIAVIYLNSGYAKLMSESWRDGTAVHYAIHLNFLHRLPVGSPDLWPLTAAATYVTLAWELAFPLMLLQKWTRRVVLTLGVALHLGMFSLMELGTFPWVMLAGYLAFVPPAWSVSIANRFRSVGAVAIVPARRASNGTAAAQRSRDRRDVPEIRETLSSVTDRLP